MHAGKPACSVCTRSMEDIHMQHTFVGKKASNDMDNTVSQEHKVHLQWFLKASIPQGPLIHITFIDWCQSTARSLYNRISETANTDQHAIHNHVHSINQNCYQYSWITPTIYPFSCDQLGEIFGIFDMENNCNPIVLECAWKHWNLLQDWSLCWPSPSFDERNTLPLSTHCAWEVLLPEIGKRSCVLLSGHCNE